MIVMETLLRLVDAVPTSTPKPDSQGGDGGLSAGWAGVIGGVVGAVGTAFAILGAPVVSGWFSKGENAKDRKHADKLARSAATLDVARLREERMRATYEEVLTWAARSRRELRDVHHDKGPWPSSAYADQTLEVGVFARTGLDCTPAFGEVLERFIGAHREAIVAYKKWWALRNAPPPLSGPAEEDEIKKLHEDFVQRDAAMSGHYTAMTAQARADLEALTTLPEEPS